MSVDYDHARNLHTLDGARLAFGVIFGKDRPASLLDVGCGTGTWLRAALDAGVTDVAGVDGVELPRDSLHVPSALVQHHDLTRPWSLGRRFDNALCLEVAEHLEAEHAASLIESLIRHTDVVIFSAACPGQIGQHHVHCRWPAYWQGLFNRFGFACDDAVRWRIWNVGGIEPWYRQNVFVATKSPLSAGSEPRIPPVVHPEMVARNVVRSACVEPMENGEYPVRWYLKRSLAAVGHKARRAMARLGARRNGATPTGS